MMDSQLILAMKELGLDKDDIKEILSQDTPKEQIILADIKKGTFKCLASSLIKSEA